MLSFVLCRDFLAQHQLGSVCAAALRFPSWGSCHGGGSGCFFLLVPSTDGTRKRGFPGTSAFLKKPPAAIRASRVCAVPWVPARTSDAEVAGGLEHPRRGSWGSGGRADAVHKLPGELVLVPLMAAASQRAILEVHRDRGGHGCVCPCAGESSASHLAHPVLRHPNCPFSC